MDISINMLMKIALVLITILLIAAAFMTLFNEGGNVITGEGEDTNERFECVNKNTDSPLEDCRDDTSNEIGSEAEVLEA